MICTNQNTMRWSPEAKSFHGDRRAISFTGGYRWS